MDNNNSGCGCGCLPIFVVIFFCFYLWWPRYDLEVALDPGPSNYQIVEKDFYSFESAEMALINYRHYDWVILEWTPWSKMFNDHSKYTKKLR